jgi:lipopolysaccharide biosynthesis glycosyltransferase
MSQQPSQPPPAALVMAFDSRMFEQAKLCIETIRTHCQAPYRLYAIAINLGPQERDWLAQEGIDAFDDIGSFPNYPDGPSYALAMTCRPFIPSLFPGHAIYMYIDPDIRFQNPDAFEFYLGNARAHPDALVICQEVDPMYSIFRQASKANYYFGTRFHRIAKVFGQDLAAKMQFVVGYNAGVFAMSATARGWECYKKRIEQSVTGPFNHMAEQDAMNVAICEDKLKLVVAPSIMNWLCMNALPGFDSKTNRYVRGEYPFLPISVLHLNNSMAIIPGEPPGTTQYKIYQRLKLTR